MTKRFGIILLHDFTMTPLSLFLDTLRLAGDQDDRSRRVAFDWQILGSRGLPIRSSCGIEILPTTELTHPDAFDYVVVVGGLLQNSKSLGEGQVAFLRQVAATKKTIIGLCTASFALAEQGLLDGYRACVSWLHLEGFQAAYPSVDACADSLFLVDRDRITCAGGTGAADLANVLAAKTVGEVEAAKAADILLMERVRSPRDLQPNKIVFGKVPNRAVRVALLAMQGSCAEPLAMHEIATKACCSPRQLERLFRAHLGLMPRQAYMAIRIERAKSLLERGQISVTEVAYQSGFKNTGHFARIFRQEVGVQPSHFKFRLTDA